MIPKSTKVSMLAPFAILPHSNHSKHFIVLTGSCHSLRVLPSHWTQNAKSFLWSRRFYTCRPLWPLPWLHPLLLTPLCSLTPLFQVLERTSTPSCVFVSALLSLSLSLSLWNSLSPGIPRKDFPYCPRWRGSPSFPVLWRCLLLLIVLIST